MAMRWSCDGIGHEPEVESFKFAAELLPLSSDDDLEDAEDAETAAAWLLESLEIAARNGVLHGLYEV